MAVGEQTATLRCHSCSQFVGTATEPMEMVGMFRASLSLRVGKIREGEIRRRCNGCGWVNVFHPMRAVRVARLFELKAK